MTTDSETDGSDFKPFFDMIVGVLFILIILISAQMFFAQRALENDTEGDKVLIRNQQIQSFIENLAERLRIIGFQPEIDLSRRRLSLGLDQVASTSIDGIPTFSDERVEAMGQVISDRMNCIFSGSARPADCMVWTQIKLGEVQVELLAGAVPKESTLSPDRFSQLASTLFSAKLLRSRPDLLSLTGSGGTALFRFRSLAPSTLRASRGLLQFTLLFEP